MNLIINFITEKLPFVRKAPVITTTAKRRQIALLLSAWVILVTVSSFFVFHPALRVLYTDFGRGSDLLSPYEQPLMTKELELFI